MATEEPAAKRLLGALRLKRAVALVWQSARGWTVASLVLMVVQGALPLASLYLTKVVVDAIATGARSANPGASFGHAAVLIGLLGGVALASAICRSLAGLVNEAQSQAATDHVSDLLHA